MDPTVLASLVFTLLMTMLVGGFVLMFPLARRLGQLMEQRLNERSLRGPAAAELAQLRDALRSVQDELQRLSERQEFTESLLAERDPLLLGKAPVERGRGE